MYRTFQRCRGARPGADACLHVLAATLAMLPEATTFIIPIPRPLGELLPNDVAEQVRVSWFAPIEEDDII